MKSGRLEPIRLENSTDADVDLLGRHCLLTKGLSSTTGSLSTPLPVPSPESLWWVFSRYVAMVIESLCSEAFRAPLALRSRVLVWVLHSAKEKNNVFLPRATDVMQLPLRLRVAEGIFSM